MTLEKWLIKPGETRVIDLEDIRKLKVGLVGGQIPRAEGSDVLVTLGRLNRIRHIDATDNTMIVEAGCTLGAAQQSAAGVDHDLHAVPHRLAHRQDHCRLAPLVAVVPAVDLEGGIAVALPAAGDIMYYGS